MDELEYYSPDEIEDMELQDWEVLGKSDFDLIDELATIRAINDYEMDPHLDQDQQALLAEAERRGLLIRKMDDDCDCEECGDRNSVDCDCHQSCRALKDLPF
jgi:hypothetical protein